MSILKVECIGYLGKDATANQVNGKQVINFTLAHTESYKKADGTKVENTTWLSASYWTESTGLLQYLRKGTLVYIEGTPAPRIYQTNQGESKIDFAVKVYSVKLLAQSKEQAGAAAAAGGAYVAPKAADITEPIDDLPF